MNKTLQIFVWGIILWLILFVIGFAIWPLHESQQLLFKTIMIVSGSLVGMIMLSYYFKRIEDNFVSEGIKVGVIWLAVNILLDLAVLVGLFQSPIGEYFTGTGLRYLNIPIMCIGIGIILKNSKSE